MNSANLLHELVQSSAARRPDSPAVTSGKRTLDYRELSRRIFAFAGGLRKLGIERNDRVGIFLEKRFESVVACFGSCAADAIFVPINPVLKPGQVAHILRDCSVSTLVTSAARLNLLHDDLRECTDLRHVILCDDQRPQLVLPNMVAHPWDGILDEVEWRSNRGPDSNVAAILYTSGSTGRPKGVVLSHRNLVAGAFSVVEYLENTARDTLLAALPLSFDAGFSQLTTAFAVGARVVLLNYLLPNDVLRAVDRERVSGLTAVPPLWIQLAQLEWPDSVTRHLRYVANTGGHLPSDTLAKLRRRLPRTKPYLMYGLTEAFRATYLRPELIDERPGSIGKAIPNTEVLVLREDGSPCAANEPGELVQRGPLVAQGYWNDPERTNERFRALPPAAPGRDGGFVLPELAVFSGDTVRMDEDGYLYFVGRKDEMIKTSGYRVSPTEVEEVLHATGRVDECAAFGAPHPVLGQTIHAIVTPLSGQAVTAEELLDECRDRMPAYMVPASIEIRLEKLPRNANGKLDRKTLAERANCNG